MTEEVSVYSYPSLSAAYWKEVIGSHYSHFIKKLLSHHVIQCQVVKYCSPCGEVSDVKGYRIAPNLLNENLVRISYFINNSGNKSSDDLSLVYDEFQPIKTLGFKPEYIRIEAKQAQEWMETGLQEIINNCINMNYADGFPDKMSVLVEVYNDDNTNYSFYSSIGKAKQTAVQQGKKLFYYKDKFVIAKVDQFKELTLSHLKQHYQWQIRSFLPEKFNFIRNTNTLRVYSSLTSLPSALLPFVRINGRYLKQADLKCSQFTLFGNLINYYLNHSGEELIKLFKKKVTKEFVSNLVTVLNRIPKIELPDEGLNAKNPIEDTYCSNDIYRFLVDTLVRDFYEIIKTELNLPQREHGKALAFKILFSKPKPENEFVKQLRALYPSVIQIINDFKEKYDYNEFSLGLQRVEAEIFIDHIWKAAKAQHINSFTRHDSLVFPITQEKEVQKIISGVFKEFDFLHRIKYEEFNTEEILLRLIDEPNYIDSTMAYIDDCDIYAWDFKRNKEKKEREERMEQECRTLEQLSDIELPVEIMNDYCCCVNLDTLSEINELDHIPQDVKFCIEEDLANLQSNWSNPFFHPKTNEFIRELVQLKNNNTDNDNDEYENGDDDDVVVVDAVADDDDQMTVP